MIAKSWLSRYWQWKFVGCVAVVGIISVGVSDHVNAQIVPDNTLGAESSVVTPNVNIRGIPSDQIDGGARQGANLFHSFSQFNVGAGRGAYFTNPAGILNILTRVTGANRSDILGRLGVNGNANLFLINPEGIVFGPSASLDVQGSFLATTANAIKLGDTGLFSASQPATSNLLTVSPSALWFNAVAAQPIVNRSQAPSPIGQRNSAVVSPGLQVRPGRTLALVGGDVLLEGGNLTAAGGRIELGSVARVGQVSLSQSGNSFVLGYDSMNDFGNILLSSGAFVDASGEGGGDIQIRGARLEMTQSSNIWADTLGAQNGGEVLVRTTEVVLSETSLLSADVTSTGTGTGGDLTIDTGRLLVQDGAFVSVGTFGEGKGGSLLITATDSVEVIGTSADGRFPSGMFIFSQGSGDAGELRIDTGRLLVRDGAQVAVSTFDEGKGGSLFLTASDSVEVIGTSADGQRSSGLFTQSRRSGDAGDLTIDTGRLLVRDGGQIVALTQGVASGGNLNINASESVEVIGTRIDELPSQIIAASGSINISDTRQLEIEIAGPGGNLTIYTSELTVKDAAQVSVNSNTSGDAGNLVIGAGSIFLNNEGKLTANSDAAQGGNITLQVKDLLLARHNSQISAQSFGANSVDGNIKIEARAIVAIPSENSDIIARSTNSGNIDIAAKGLFGFEFREQLTPESDITATGRVTSNVPDIDPNQESAQLPSEILDTESLIASSCIVRRNEPTRGSFFITGTGGLPERPGDAQMSTFPTVDIETLPSDGTPTNTNPNRPWQKGDPIVEPQGVYRLPNGKLVLSRECP